jgi:pilus assembly protein Flp/PilA
MLLCAVQKLMRRDEGATMVEYGLMLALIAVICLVAVSTVGTGASTIFTSTSASL